MARAGREWGAGQDAGRQALAERARLLAEQEVALLVGEADGQRAARRGRELEAEAKEAVLQVWPGVGQGGSPLLWFGGGHVCCSLHVHACLVFLGVGEVGRA